MSEVTVLGAGEMGSALLRSGRTTVWNRTPDRAAPAMGARAGLGSLGLRGTP